jgi:hypothetical protein
MQRSRRLVHAFLALLRNRIQRESKQPNTQTNMHLHTYTCTYSHTQTHMHTHTHTRTHICLCTHIHTNMHTHAYVHTHTHTHIHARPVCGGGAQPRRAVVPSGQEPQKRARQNGGAAEKGGLGHGVCTWVWLGGWVGCMTRVGQNHAFIRMNGDFWL